MGMEMDLRELTPDEAATLKASIATFKETRDLIHSGTLHRLESADPDVIAEMHVKDERFLLLSAQMQPSRQQLARPLRLTGLDPDAHYTIRLDTTQIVEVMNRGNKNPLLTGAPITLTGAALMNHGIQLPNSFPDTIWTVTGERQ